MFANTQMMGLDTGFPDVCLTPTPAGPVPAASEWGLVVMTLLGLTTGSALFRRTKQRVA